MLRQRATLVSTSLPSVRTHYHHPPLSQPSQLFNSSFITEYSYINGKTCLVSNQTVLFPQYNTPTPIPLPIVRDGDIPDIRRVDQLSPDNVRTLKNGSTMYGFHCTNHIVSIVNDPWGDSTIPLGFYSHDDDDRSPHKDMTYDCLNRNARRGKRANKGKRACSRQNRRKRRRRFGNHRR